MTNGETGHATGLVVRDLVVIRGERLVLDGVSLRLAPGEAMILRGPNGAGKSTLLRVLAGLRRADAGEILLDGEVQSDPVELGARMAYLGHRDALKMGLTLRENLMLAASASGEAPEPAMAAFGVEDLADLPARMLSAGQARRAALARTILPGRQVWLLDEPSLGLDSAAIERLGRVLAAHRARGGIVLATTHVPLPIEDAREHVLSPPAQGVYEAEIWA